LLSIATASSLAPHSKGAPKQIVLLLHGYGSNGDDLISLAPHWQQELPDAIFLAPNAPERCPGMFAGYQWWGLASLAPQALAAGAEKAAPVLDAYIDARLEEYGLSEAQLAIVGFSQGTMIALHVGLRRQRRVAGILGYSGMLIGAAALADDSITRPPVLLVHGSADPVVPVAALHEAKAALQRLEIDVETHVCPGLGHSVDPTGLRLGGAFVRRVLDV
jgi:phospholipase/carboxylesterase